MKNLLQQPVNLFVFLLFFGIASVANAGVTYGENLQIKQYSIGFILNWTTTQETDCQFFEVQRSINGSDFKTLGTINAAGNSEDEKTYTFEDMELGLKKVEYRLKDISADGTSSLSDPVNFEKDYVANFMISGIDNKVSAGFYSLTLNTIVEQEMSIIINSEEGNIVKTEKWFLNYGLNDIPVDLTTEEDGKYSVILKVGKEMEILSVEKMIEEEKKANVAVKRRKGGG